jgi:hypothetical protein
MLVQAGVTAFDYPQAGNLRSNLERWLLSNTDCLKQSTRKFQRGISVWMKRGQRSRRLSPRKMHPSNRGSKSRRCRERPSLTLPSHDGQNGCAQPQPDQAGDRPNQYGNVGTVGPRAALGARLGAETPKSSGFRSCEVNRTSRTDRDWPVLIGGCGYFTAG